MIRNFLLCLLSAGLLILSFPQSDYFFLAWIGLIPLMKLLDGKKFSEAFGWSYFCGLIFFGVTLYWFVFVHPAIAFIGLPLMILYLALYFGIFGLAYAFIFSQKSLLKIIFLPCLWVTLEFIRAHLLSGFDWASLGYSQYKFLPIIQIADVSGVFGVSFVVVLFNVCLKEIWGNLKEKFSLIVVTTIVLASVLIYGTVRLTQEKVPTASRSVAVIQGNIAQEIKWQETAWATIMDKYMTLTEAAIESKERAELIIWPESSFPGFLWDDWVVLMKMQKLIKEKKVPLLFGSIVEEKGKYYNAAILLDSDGKVVKQYNKMHLVAFGEYMPLRSIFPFLSTIVPIEDFTAGEEHTIFSLPQKFSVVICFEDSIARLVRKFVQNGAELLVNITNDGWFQDTRAPFMHLQASVFRAVENRRTVIRAANTGVSGFIDPWGKTTGFVENQDGKKTYVDGFKVQKVNFYTEQSFYTKHGDVFAFFCIVCILGSVFGLRKRNPN